MMPCGPKTGSRISGQCVSIEAGPAHQEEVRDDRHLLGHHQRRHEEEADQRRAGEAHARQRVAGERGEDAASTP